MVNISPENYHYLEHAVQAGVYPDTASAMDEAVNLLRLRDKLRADVHAGIQQADQGELLPAEDVFRRLEQRAQEIESQASAQQ